MEEKEECLRFPEADDDDDDDDDNDDDELGKKGGLPHEGSRILVTFLVATLISAGLLFAICFNNIRNTFIGV